MAIKDDQLRQVINIASQDPDFKNLAPDAQDRLVERLAQEKFGATPRSENVLQRAIRGQGQKIQQTVSDPANIASGFLAGGPSLAGLQTGAGVEEPEQGLPSALQLTGNIAGTGAGLLSSGTPFRGGAIGGTLGRTSGEAARQGIRSVTRGEEFDTRQLGEEAAIGFGTELMGAGLGRATSAIFSGEAGKFFGNIVGKNLGTVKNQIAKSGIKIPFGAVRQGNKGLSFIKDSFGGRLNELVGTLDEFIPLDDPILTSAQKTFKRISEKAAKSGGFVDAEDLFRIKNRLDRILVKAGVFSKEFGEKSPLKVDFQDAAKLRKIRNFVDDQIFDVAKQAGPDVARRFQRANRAFAETAQRFGTGKKSGAGAIFPQILRAGGAFGLLRGAAQQDPEAAGEGLGNLLGAEVVESRAAAPAAAGVSGALSRISPTVLAETISQTRKRSRS